MTATTNKKPTRGHHIQIPFPVSTAWVCLHSLISLISLSRYSEDVYESEHTSVWGSWWPLRCSNFCRGEGESHSWTFPFLDSEVLSRWRQMGLWLLQVSAQDRMLHCYTCFVGGGGMVAGSGASSWCVSASLRLLVRNEQCPLFEASSCTCAEWMWESIDMLPWPWWCSEATDEKPDKKEKVMLPAFCGFAASVQSSVESGVIIPTPLPGKTRSSQDIACLRVSV